MGKNSGRQGRDKILGEETTYWVRTVADRRLTTCVPGTVMHVNEINYLPLASFLSLSLFRFSFRAKKNKKCSELIL